MVPEDDARSAVELDDRYVILPKFGFQHDDVWKKQGAPCPDGFVYSSDTNDCWLTGADLGRIIAELDFEEAEQWAREMGIA